MTEKIYRLSLYNGKNTDWFGLEDLTQMVKKHEGRIVTIETKIRTTESVDSTSDCFRISLGETKE